MHVQGWFKDEYMYYLFLKFGEQKVTRVYKKVLCRLQVDSKSVGAGPIVSTSPYMSATCRVATQGCLIAFFPSSTTGAYALNGKNLAKVMIQLNKTIYGLRRT